MNIVLGFSPFIALFVVLRLGGPLPGLGAALLISVVLCLRMARRGESVKVLELGSLVLFAALTLYTVAAQPAWTVATLRLVVDGGLLAVVLASLAVGRPFTLQYARERVPAQLWETPAFRRTNTIITLVWAGAFVVLVGADAAAHFLPAVPIWIEVAATVAALYGAFRFTTWYPASLAARRAANFAG
jgi:hypothetical protein